MYDESLTATTYHRMPVGLSTSATTCTFAIQSRYYYTYTVHTQDSQKEILQTSDEKVWDCYCDSYCGRILKWPTQHVTHPLHNFSLLNIFPGTDKMEFGKFLTPFKYCKIFSTTFLLMKNLKMANTVRDASLVQFFTSAHFSQNLTMKFWKSKVFSLLKLQERVDWLQNREHSCGSTKCD